MNLLAQDVLILLKLAVSVKEKDWTYQSLGAALGLSASQVHAGIKRATKANLYGSQRKRPIRAALEELLIHGVKYVYIAEMGSVARGIPTAHSSPFLRNSLAVSEDDSYVWPDPNGQERGIGLSPLAKSAPYAAMRDDSLYEALALLDAIRIGRARERHMAGLRLTGMLKSHV